MPGRAKMTLLACLCAGAGAIAGCGSEEEGTIPPEQSDALIARLDALEDKLAEGQCEGEDGAGAQATEIARIVDQDLPEGVDQEVRDALDEAATRLIDLTDTQCVETGATDTTTEKPDTTTEEETTPTETVTEETTPTETEEEPTDTGDGGSGSDGGGSGSTGGGNTGTGNTGGGNTGTGNTGGGNTGGQPDVDVDPADPAGQPSGGIGGDRSAP